MKVAKRSAWMLALGVLALGVVLALGALRLRAGGRGRPPAAHEEVHIAFAACGDRADEALMMVKSAVLATRGHLTFHAFADDAVRPEIAARLAAWPERVKERFSLKVYPISYPGAADPEKWKALFKPCATQRLFMPYLVEGTDRALYVDTDILFLRPPEDIWAFFADFDDRQLAALAPETESPGGSWYKRFAKHPYYPPYGMNSGVMLMDFARMRARGWRERMIDYRARYTSVPWGDQDLINIYFHDSPEELSVFACDFNYRPDHCQYGSDCHPAEVSGASVLHGNRGSFHTGKVPAYKAVYDTYGAFDLERDPAELPGAIRSALAALSGDEHGCSKVPGIFEKRVSQRFGARGGDDGAVPADEYRDVAREQLDPWRETGITVADLERVVGLGRPFVKYQIIGKRLYRSPKCRREERCAAVDGSLSRLAAELPDLEIHVNLEDRPGAAAAEKLPVLSASKEPLLSSDILFPSWSFARGEGGKSWAEARRELLDAAAAAPWEGRRPAVFFRGPRPPKGFDAFFLPLVEDAARWDVRPVDGAADLGLPPAEPVSPPGRCAHRYLLHFEGGEETYRLKERLACGALVLHVRPRAVEFFSSKLLPWRHYIPLDRRAEDAVTELEMLRQNDAFARQIAERGRDFVEHHLGPEQVEGYWLHLLREYASLQRFTPRRDDSLIEVAPGGAKP
jgi:UDP-xylose:glucoside alpha-1,3-xylosyltransferase